LLVGTIGAASLMDGFVGLAVLLALAAAVAGTAREPGTAKARRD